MRAKWMAGLLLVLAACSGPSSGGEPDAETLRPGSAVVTDLGVLVGAPDGVLEAPVEVRAEVVTAEPEVSVPVSLRAHGPWYRVTSDRDVRADEGGGFVIGLPVPSGADPDRLAVAVRVPAEENVYDAGYVEPGGGEHPEVVPEPGDDVAYLRGTYDPEREAFHVAFYELPADGDEVRLMEGPSFAPAGTHIDGPATQTHRRFVTYCHPEFGDIEETCRLEDLLDAAAALEDAYVDFTGLGFPEPKMYREPGTIHYEDGRPVFVPGPWAMTLRACSQTGRISGKYTGTANATSTWSCMGPNGVTMAAVQTIRHEYFHATQWAYDSLSANSESWLVESTATVAERSLDTLERNTWRAVRDVNVRLDGGAQKYMAQDFWLYLGMRHGMGVDMLIPFLAQGGTSDAADRVIGFAFPEFSGLGDAYWGWAKHQAFEKTVPLGGSGFATTCGLDTNAAGEYYALAPADVGPTDVAYAREAPPGDATFTLEPLTSEIVRLTFDRWSGGTYDQGMEVLGHPDLRVKYVEASDVGSDRCVANFESRAHHVTVAANDRVVYALIANTGRQANRTATLRFVDDGDGPAVDVVAPAQNSLHAEGDVTFRAVVSGFGGSDPSLLRVRWSHVVDGALTVLANSASGESVDIELCNGTHTIAADVIDPNTTLSVGDTVTLVVERSDDPPDACLPTVDIIQPRTLAEVAYAEGEGIPLEAAVDSDPPEYEVIWRVGSAVSGRIVGRGLTGTAKLGAGVHTLWAVYGPVEHGITIRVTDGSDALPTATIEDPPGDLTIPASHQGFACDTVVPLAGSASDPEDGVLPDSKLQWHFREAESASSWTFLGFGATSSLSIRCGQSYEVRLRASDSALQSAADTVVITYLAPTN